MSYDTHGLQRCFDGLTEKEWDRLEVAVCDHPGLAGGHLLAVARRPA